ncbi:MAG: copper homeostasis protein CutC [Brevinema sp.]
MLKISPLLLESCVENFSEAKKAQENGANRIELCDNLVLDGTTPSLAMIEFVQQKLSVPTAIIVRPRGGDFEYNDLECDLMLYYIELCDQIGVEGIVVGALKGRIFNKEFMDKARKHAKNSKIIAHMAFDHTQNLEESLDLLIELGFDRVLTKGGFGKAIDNLDTLKELIIYATGRITVVVGGGVTKDNVHYIADHTGATELHGRLIV